MNRFFPLKPVDAEVVTKTREGEEHAKQKQTRVLNDVLLVNMFLTTRVSFKI